MNPYGVSDEVLSAMMQYVSEVGFTEGIVVGGKIKQSMLYGSDNQKADTLYDSTYRYLREKKYREAEICLKEIEKLNCWDGDDTLAPATYATYASLYFNIAIKEHKGHKYKLKDFEKPIRYAEKSLCFGSEKGRDFDMRTKTGAWQVLFASSVLLGDIIKACEYRAKYNVYNLVTKYLKPFEHRLEWYVFNEINPADIERSFNELLKKRLYNNPDDFDYLYSLHLEHKDSVEYTEALTYVATFVEDNLVKTVCLYDDLFQKKNLNNTSFEDYLWIMCEKLCAYIHWGDKNEVRKTLNNIETLKQEHEEDFSRINTEVKDEYCAVKLYALITIGRYEDALTYACSLEKKEMTDQILYCISKIKEHYGMYDEAERAVVSSLSIEIDVFKIIEAAKIYLLQKKYGEALNLYSWACRGIELDRRKGYLTQSPKFLPSMVRTTKSLQKEIYKAIIDTSVAMDKYDIAENYVDKYGRIEETDDVEILKMEIMRNRNRYEETCAVNLDNKKITEELKYTHSKLEEMIEIQKKWYNELVEAQFIDQTFKVTNEVWDQSQLDNKMSAVIEKVRNALSLNGLDGYELELKKVSERYPDMSDKAKQFLASAEQLYDVFENNPLIDCAPALVEYARVYEEGLWSYIEKSEEYLKPAEEQLKKKHPRSLGTAGYVISHFEGPLKSFAEEIQEITDMRNDSAHAYISKIPHIENIRGKIWTKERNLLDELMI